MGEYMCKKCGYKFSQKSHFVKHLEKKKPCIDKQDLIDNLVKDELEGQLKKLCPQFGELSKSLTKDLSKKTKKDKGIFFTPYNIIKKSCSLVIDYCSVNNIVIRDILEPSCGSCEYIKFLDYHLDLDVSIDGIEYDDTIYDRIKDMDFRGTVELTKLDYLKYDSDKKYDLIIGNPPYFVVKKTDVNKEYNSFYDGRPNMFILFIIHSLFKLKENGILTFILPKSFCNCLYYNKLRSYINDNYTIIDIVDCSSEKYLDTAQETIIFSIINKKDNAHNNIKYTYNNNGNILMNTPVNISKITKLYENTTNLGELNFSSKVGSTVWNQCKDILTDDETFTRLIYSGDIVENKLGLTDYKNEEKKNYIMKEGINTPILVVNRGYGVGHFTLTYSIIDIDKEFLIENHLIIIRSNDDLSKEELLTKFNMIVKSFDNPKTQEFIQLYCCNSALNTNELINMLPIYV
tara:strand:+ start:665 stop:2044 length:1380 start_codon:yes stop_codon:yes gene_type:complete